MSTLVKKTIDSSGPSPNHEIIRYGVGFDVHKHVIVVCVGGQISSGEIVILKEHSFTATPKGLGEIIQFLKKYTPISQMLMECTGVYHLPLYHALEKEFPNDKNQIMAMNPLLLNRKLSDLDSHTDKADARGLARLSFYTSLLRPSYVGSELFFQTRDFIRSYHKSRVHSTRLRQRILRSLSSINCKFPFDLSKEWCIQLLDYFISYDGTFSEAYKTLLKQYIMDDRPIKVLKKQAKFVLQFGDISLSKPMKQFLQIELFRLLQEEANAAFFLHTAESLILKNPDSELKNAYQRLNLIPGIGGVSALTILIELGNYYRFDSWKALAKYCGVVPLLYQSGLSSSKGHVNKFSNKFLRKALVQAATTLITRISKEHDLGEFAYRQYKIKGLPFKKATIKVAQKLSRTIYYVLVEKREYNPNHEQILRKKKILQRRLRKQETILENSRVRGLKRNIQEFLVSNHDLLNSTSKYHLTSGFTRIIRKATA